MKRDAMASSHWAAQAYSLSARSALLPGATSSHRYIEKYPSIVGHGLQHTCETVRGESHIVTTPQ